MLQHFLTNNIVKQNIFVAGAQNVFVSNPAATNDGTIFDFNCYFARAGADRSEWMWKNVEVAGFEGWKAATGQDANSIFADPLLVNVRRFDLHLKPGSPAVNAGDAIFVVGSNELDIDGGARVVGGRVEIGADELAP